MAITPPPTPPNTGDPAFLEQRADAFFGWFPTFVSQFNADLPFISSKGWATYGGSANAINLTAGFVSLLRGTQVRFRATAANTGAATINLDGLGARQCRTITGVALPAGYIRTDVDTVATYDGTNWVLSREAQRGNNANGDFVRYADGRQTCIGVLNLGDTSTAQGSGFTSANMVWTFPAGYIAAPAISGIITSGPPDAWISLGSNATSFTDTSIAAKRFQSYGVNNSIARVTADGFWY